MRGEEGLRRLPGRAHVPAVFEVHSRIQEGRGHGYADLGPRLFLEGDRELVDDDLLFLFGLMGQLAEIIQTHQSALVN